MTREEFIVRIGLLGWVRLGSQTPADRVVRSLDDIAWEPETNIYGPPKDVVDGHFMQRSIPPIDWYFIVLERTARKFNKSYDMSFDAAFTEVSALLDEANK